MNRKIFIVICIILLAVLWGQLYYYAHQKEEEVEIPYVYTLPNETQLENELVTATTQIESINDNYSILFDNYKGVVTKEEFDTFINDFIDNRMKNLYYELLHKTDNDIKYYYDNNKESLNLANIYSGEDLIKIKKQLYRVNWSKRVVCITRNINMSTVNYDANGYTTFDIDLLFTNNYSMRFKISLANDNSSEKKIILTAE